MNKRYPLLIGAFLLTVTATVAATSTFTDEATFADWYKDAVKHLQSQGVITGYEDGRFLPNDSVTRGELALILERYEEKIVQKYMEEHKGDYFENHIQEVIKNTLKYANEDIYYHYKSAIIMAESGIKKLSEAPKLAEMGLEQKDIKLPEGYTIYEQIYDETIYVHYKGERDAEFGDTFSVDEWYGPF